MDVIEIKGLKIFAHHGVFKEEKEKGQTFYVDINLELRTRTAGKSDYLPDTISYADVALFAKEVFTKKKYSLIEAAAENLAEKLLLKFDLTKAVTITVHKPEAPIPAEFSDVSLTIRRKWHEAYVSVGSNIGDGEQLIADAKKKITEDKRNILLKESHLSTTKAYGKTDQDDFTNGFFIFRTLLTPEEFLRELNRIEVELGRVRVEHWGPRTIDLDIIYYDDLIIDSEQLTVPHYDMCNREFVLKPLEEVAPHKRHPINGKLPAELLRDLQEKEK